MAKENKHLVYELVNLMGTVEYVGETVNARRRFNNHKSNSKGNGSGKFYGRQDIFMNIVKDFDTKKEAYDYQIKLQKDYGLVTDDESRNHKNGGIAASLILKECPHCKHVGKMPSIFSHHFNNCKYIT